MVQPVKAGAALIRDIEGAVAQSPTLWWLGHSGFAIKYGNSIFYIDPYLSNSQAVRYRRTAIARDRLMAGLAPRA